MLWLSSSFSSTSCFVGFVCLFTFNGFVVAGQPLATVVARLNFDMHDSSRTATSHVDLTLLVLFQTFDDHAMISSTTTRDPTLDNSLPEAFVRQPHDHHLQVVLMGGCPRSQSDEHGVQIPNQRRTELHTSVGSEPDNKSTCPSNGTDHPPKPRFAPSLH